MSQINPTGTPPIRRDDASLVFDSVNNRGVLFGGYKSGSGEVNETWVLDLNAGNESRSELFPSNPPASREKHTGVYDPATERMFVWGTPGNTVDVLSLALGGEGWTTLATSGSPPTARSRHVAAFDADNNRMIVYGGTDDLNVYALTLGASPVRSIVTTGGGRYNDAVAVYDQSQGRMLLFGGVFGTESNALWELDLTLGTESWNLLMPFGRLPEPRVVHAGAFDTTSQRFVVFGGQSSGTMLKDTWWY